MTESTDKDMAFAIFKTLSALGHSKAAASLAKEIKKKYSVTAIPDMDKVLKLAEVESKKEESDSSSSSSSDDSSEDEKVDVVAPSKNKKIAKSSSERPIARKKSSSSSTSGSDSDSTADLKTNKAQEKKDDSDSGSSSSDSSDDEKEEKVATPVKEKEVSSSSDSSEDDDDDEPEPPRKKAKANSGEAIKSHAVSPEDSDVSDVDVSDVSSVSSDDDSSSSSDDDDSSSEEEDDEAKIEDIRKAKRKVAAENAKKAAEAALSWTPKKSKAVDVKTEVGSDGAHVLSTGKPFQRVDDTYWGEKALADGGAMADNSYGNVFGDTGYGAKSSEKLLQVRGKKFRHEKTKRKRSFNGLSRNAGGIDMKSNSTKYV
jgi:hypothetical protein